MIKVVHKKTNYDIAKEWDKACIFRKNDIESGKDLTYNNVLIPLFVSEVKKKKYNNVLDAGCGLGYISKNISPFVKQVVAIDISKKSIEIAKKINFEKNISYINKSLELMNSNIKFDLIIMNMFLMDCLYLEEALEKTYDISLKNVDILVTIPNPNIMPRYWGYEKYKWFNYKNEIIIESNFIVSGEVKEFKTTHIHRPIERYLSIFYDKGFYVSCYKELTGHFIKKRKIIEKYPRILFFKLNKI